MKRVLIFSLAYYPNVGGAEVAIKEITDRIPSEDVKFDMITMKFDRRDSDVERIGNVRVYRVKGLECLGYFGKVLFPLLAALGAWRLHRINKYNALWAMMLYMTFPIVILRLLGIKLPYAVTIQEGDPYSHVFERWYIKIFSPLLKFGFRHANVIQSISNFLAGWAKHHGYKGLVEVIPNGVDTKRFKGEKIAHENTVLITSSRLVEKNAVDDVIQALVDLPNIRFQVLGVGQEEINLRKLTQKLGISDQVDFLGYVDHREMPRYLHSADIFIRPSRSEGMGNSFIEAMAAGLPVIATQEGGIADFLFDAKRNPDKPTTGWAVDKDSPKQITEAVKKILENQEITKKVVENARKLAFEKYDWDLIAHNMREKVFARLLS